MVYRSSRRPLANEEEAANLQENISFGSNSGDKDVTFSLQASMWKNISIILGIVCTALLVGILIIVNSSDGQGATPVCGTGSKSVNRVMDLSEPDRPGPFHDLTKKEIKSIVSFLEKDPSVKLKRVEVAKMDEAVLYTMEILPGKKSDIQAYLQGTGPQPDRQARVILFRRDLNPPMVHELVCGPLPDVKACPLLKSNSRRNPIEYSLRPFGFLPDMLNMFDVLFPKVDKQIGYILRESYGASYANCQPKECLKFYPAPMGSNVAGDVNARKMWMTALYNVEYYGLYILDFGMLANLESLDAADHYISKIWYNGQYFESVDDFIVKYNQSRIQKTSMRPPAVEPKDSFSSLYRRGDPVPEHPQRPPTLVEPDGKRYSVKHREVEYLGWNFNFRMSPLSGPVVNNVRYRGERIAYEMSLADMAVLYSAHNPMQQMSDYSDSGVLMGVMSKSLVPGADCPDTATFISQTFPGQTGSEPTVYKRGFCLFENNNGYPTRRHLSHSEYEGFFYGGMLDSALILRSIQTVVNYDYVIDFIFHQSGAVQTRIISTDDPRQCPIRDNAKMKALEAATFAVDCDLNRFLGNECYILPSFYNVNETPYGWNTHKDFLAPMHHHIFHFKVDLDISGTSNRYETLNIKPDKVLLKTPPNKEYHQTKFERSLKRTEKEALFKYDFEQPKYHVVHNEAKKTDLGQIKAYRIHMNGMSKHLLAENRNNEISFSWARHQLVVTKQKDDEIISGSPYAMYDSINPVTNFSKFYDDDDNIVDEDLVFWISSGLYHIPHSEDVPITPTIGAHLDFYLLPYNYFPYCPSFNSRDHVHIHLKDHAHPYKGATVERHGYEEEQCKTQKYATAYDELLKKEPDVVFEV